jgi:hypothetical protein
VKQNIEALKLANSIRLERAATRSQMNALPYDQALERAASLVEIAPRHLRTLEVGKLLTWARRLTRDSRLQMLRRAGVSELALIGWLTDRQRTALGAELVGRAECYRERHGAA